jgi:Flp pilus assembly protein CpaB
MVMTRSEADGVGRDPEVPVARHRVERLRGLPTSRALVGGLLVALAGVGTLVAWQRAAGSPEHEYAVASRPILPGETLSAEDVRLVPIDLPAGVAGAAFTDAGSVAERVALGPIGEGELVQLSELSDPGVAEAVAEVSLALDRDRAVDGRLRSGDVVDVFATYDDRTEAVVERVRVVGVSDAGGASFTSGAQVTVTLALTDASRRAPVIHAARAGEVTLVRSTHLPASTAPAPSASTAPTSGPPTPPTDTPTTSPPGGDE